MNLSELPSVLLDIDGVAANFIAGCLPVIKNLTGRDHHHDEVDNFFIEKALGLDDAQTGSLYEHVASPGWCRALPPYEGAREAVEAIRKFATIHAVTAQFFSGKQWTYDREEWIVEHLGIPKTDVIHTHAKWKIDGDVLVDDKVSHLVAWQKKHPLGRAVLFKRRYNQDGSWKGPVVEDWPHLVGSLETHFASYR